LSRGIALRRGLLLL